MLARKARLIAAGIAVLHCLAAGVTAALVGALSDGQAAMTWGYWVFVDFPLSIVLWSLMPGQFFLAHGIVGSIWWFWLSRGVLALSGRVLGRWR
jgi:hypothetical protein